jgi:hypothetical protein
MAFHSGTAVKEQNWVPMIRGMTSMTLPSSASKYSQPWALQVKATTMCDASRLVQTLTGAILASGGWVLSRGANDAGLVNMLFEFERLHCVDIYTVLVAVGLELSQLGHIRFTELCQCTKSQNEDCGAEIVSVDLEIHTFPAETMSLSRPVSDAA